MQRSVRGGRLYGTYPVNLRLHGRDIPRQAIVEAVDPDQLVDADPPDQSRPSYVILARFDNDAFPRVWAIDLAGDHVRVGTAYRPSRDAWGADLPTRRTRRCRVQSVGPSGNWCSAPCRARGAHSLLSS